MERNKYERLHPESLQTLRQLIRLHGAERVIQAVRDLEAVPAGPSLQQRDGWVQAAVGCHWTKGPYTISTISQGARSGYVAVRHPGHQLAEFVSWDEARAAVKADEAAQEAAQRV